MNSDHIVLPRQAKDHMLRLFTCVLVALATSAGCAESQQGDGSQPVPSGAEYVASSRGQVYYAIGCDAWRDLATDNLVWFGSIGEAEEAGYEPSSSAGCSPPREVEDGSICVVRSVTDGDTLVCEGGLRVRLLLIDSPEMDQGEFGTLARHHLLSLAPVGTRLRLELDVQERDRYGRVLAYLYGPGGRFLNEEMARSGYALPLTYPPNVQYVERIRAAVEQARKARAGLWRTAAFECPPADHRAGRCEGG